MKIDGLLDALYFIDQQYWASGFFVENGGAIGPVDPINGGTDIEASALIVDNGLENDVVVVA